MRREAALVFILILFVAVFAVSACGGGARSEPTMLPTSTVPPEPTSTPFATATALPPTVAPVVTQALATEPTLLNLETTDGLEDLLSAQIADLPSARPGLAPGAVLLVYTNDGRFLDARGVSDLASGRAMHVDDRFEIGSITKVFTAVLLLQLHEEGLLSLDDTLAHWLPDIAAVLPYGDEMTLRQLASHTAGLADYERDLYPMPDLLTDAAVLERQYSPQELATWIADRQQPIFAPGAAGQWRYSSGGYALLGLVLEAVTGQPLSELYRTHIFDPLGMGSAVVLEGVPEDGQIVSGYFSDRQSGRGEYVDVTRWNPSGAWAAGSLAMNAADLASFAQALLDGQLFAEDETLATMANFAPTGQPRGFTGYGLGIATLDDHTWGHAGGTPGFAAQLLLWPEEKILAIYLANSGTANIPPDEFAQIIEEAIR